MKSIQVEIRGISPLLMHQFPLVQIEAFEKKTPAEQADISAYRDPETGKLYIPGTNLQRSLVSAANYSKGKGRGSLARVAAACLFVSPERLCLGVKNYEVDSRPVVVPATKGRVLRHRAKLETWSVKFEIEYDETLLTEAQVRRVVDDAGKRVGVLDFRPEKKGPFGRFMVISWVCLGAARLGWARHGQARLGWAGHGRARQGEQTMNDIDDLRGHHSHLCPMCQADIECDEVWCEGEARTCDECVDKLRREEAGLMPFRGNPSELINHLRQIVAEACHCKAVLDYDDRTHEPRGVVTDAEAHEIKNRMNLLFLFGAEREVPMRRAS